MTPLTRRLVIALSVSAAINLFLLGFMAARGFGGPPPPPVRGEVAEGPVGKHGGPPLRRMLRESGVDMRADRRAMREARWAVAQSLRAEPFDVEVLSNSLQNLREVTGGSQRKLHDALLKAAPSMTPQQRKRLSKNRHLLGGGRPKRRGGPRR